MLGGGPVVAGSESWKKVLGGGSLYYAPQIQWAYAFMAPHFRIGGMPWPNGNGLVIGELGMSGGGRFFGVTIGPTTRLGFGAGKEEVSLSAGVTIAYAVGEARR
jgi:hypothetical protein